MHHSYLLILVLCTCSVGGALIDIGESMKRMAEVKDSLDIDVKQNFIDPLQGVAEKDIKDIQVETKRGSLLLHIQAKCCVMLSVYHLNEYV